MTLFGRLGEAHTAQAPNHSSHENLTFLRNLTQAQNHSPFTETWIFLRNLHNVHKCSQMFLFHQIGYISLSFLPNMDNSWGRLDMVDQQCSPCFFSVVFCILHLNLQLFFLASFRFAVVSLSCSRGPLLLQRCANADLSLHVKDRPMQIYAPLWSASSHQWLWRLGESNLTRANIRLWESLVGWLVVLSGCRWKHQRLV